MTQQQKKFLRAIKTLKEGRIISDKESDTLKLRLAQDEAIQE